MAHFAQLNDQQQVIQVIVVNNDTLGNLPFPESEPVGVDFCQSLYGRETIWKQTSYNKSFRYNYAGVGYSFDETAQPHGAFIAPQPFPSWVLNTEIYGWYPPVPPPEDGHSYRWDEPTVSWIKVR
jgi:hypothetical protein